MCVCVWCSWFLLLSFFFVLSSRDKKFCLCLFGFNRSTLSFRFLDSHTRKQNFVVSRCVLFFLSFFSENIHLTCFFSFVNIKNYVCFVHLLIFFCLFSWPICLCVCVDSSKVLFFFFLLVFACLCPEKKKWWWCWKSKRMLSEKEDQNNGKFDFFLYN